MVVTILASLFLLAVIVIALFGYKVITNRISRVEKKELEKCMICNKSFDRTLLAEVQIGDYKIIYFCKSCVDALSSRFSKKMS